VNDIHPYIHVGGTFLDSLSTSVITQVCEAPSGTESTQDILICIIIRSIVGSVDLEGLLHLHFGLCLCGESFQRSILIHNAVCCWNANVRTINSDRSSSNSEAPGGNRM